MRDNIAMPSRRHQRMIMDAAKAAQMHDFILEMKVQYETLIGQRHQSLRGHANVHWLGHCSPTRTTILDDCTSASTPIPSRKSRRRRTVGKTAIMVSMRVSMAMRCHKICVIEDGRVTEFGSHEELLKHNGFYARLYHQQTE